MKVFGQGTGEPLPGCVPFVDGQAIDAAFDVEDRIDPRHGFQRNGRDVVGGFAFADIALDIGKLEELASGMAPAQRADDRSGIAVGPVEVVVAAVGIGLQNTLPPGEMPVRVGQLAVAGEVKQGRWRRAACKRPIIPDIGPEPCGLRAAPGQQRHRGVIHCPAGDCEAICREGPCSRSAARTWALISAWIGSSATAQAPTWSARVERLRSTPSRA